MGNWFSNLHIRKNGNTTEKTVADSIRRIMEQRKRFLVNSEDEADGAFAILFDANSEWVSVYSDLFSFDNVKEFTNYAVPMSTDLGTDILCISCFDSDYLYLNLINAGNNVDAWAGCGSSAGLGIGRRTNLKAWKNQVDDYDCFKESFKKKYVFAEEILSEIEHCIHLPAEYSNASYEYLVDFDLTKKAVVLYFKLPEDEKPQMPPKLVFRSEELMPCFLDKPSIVSVMNEGGASKGLSVYFVGPYVEHEEITFSDVCFVKWKNGHTEAVPIELKKVQLADGQWVYYYHDPDYKIMPEVDDRLPLSKRIEAVNQHSITVRFVPHGNPRKILDITVVFCPDKNPEGQVGWNSWHVFGSKKAYIKYHNKIWSNQPGQEHLLLREEDFD